MIQRRRNINDRLVKWIAERAARDFAGDISLVVIYGSFVNGTDNHMSDVDCYFVPKTQRGEEFSLGFILDGVGYDIFPVSWERLDGIADLKESLIPLLGDGRVIYCDSEEDMVRFEALQKRLRENLSDEGYVRGIAAARCEYAAGLAGVLRGCRKGSDMRVLSGYIAMFLAEAVGFVNHDYCHYGLKKQFEDLCMRFADVPQEIREGYRGIAEAETAEKAAELAEKLLVEVCCYVGCECSIPQVSEDEEEPGSPDADSLAELYEEIVSTFNKIYVCCESGDHILAFLSAVCLQHELKCAGFDEFELFSGYDHKKPDVLRAVTLETERQFVAHIESKGGKIKRYADFEEFAGAQK